MLVHLSSYKSRALAGLLGTQFSIVCLFPQTLNRCVPAGGVLLCCVCIGRLCKTDSCTHLTTQVCDCLLQQPAMTLTVPQPAAATADGTLASCLKCIVHAAQAASG